MAKMEILAPAGNYESFIQAINNGADAIYLAGKTFGARASATNFSNEELYEMIKEAHLMGVKIYVTVNTVIKDDEFNDAINFIKDLYLHDVDAVIVQDLGLMDEAIRRFPDLDVHVSTQVNVHSVEQTVFLKNLGVKRVILARETSLKVIKEIVKNVDIEVEVFAHGALCMSYSGNCYLSSFNGGRSGNRGRCAQPCRLTYDLDNKGNAYHLSPKDLMTIDHLDELKAAGVHSLKIEGRMRRPEYVGLAVKAYRDALDNHNTNYKKDLALMFNREFTKGYMFNEDNALFSNIKSSNHIGLEVGKVVRSDYPYAFIKLTDEVNLGDSLRIMSSSIDAVTISEMYVDGDFTRNAKINDVIKVRVHKDLDIDSIVLKTTDSELLDKIASTPSKKIELNAQLDLQDNYLVLSITDGINTVIKKTDSQIQEARNSEFNNRIIAQINKTGDSIYYFKDIIGLDTPIFLPIKEINNLRREAIEEMNKLRISRPSKRINEIEYQGVDITHDRRLYAKINRQNDLDKVRNSGINYVITENNINETNNTNIYHISPRIHRRNANYNASGNIGNINSNCYLSNVYLNVFNARTVNLFHRLGVKTIGLSIELNKFEIENLVKTYRQLYKTSPNLLVMVYGYYEMMILKHCPINKAENEDKMFCNKCMEKQYYLTNQSNDKYPLANDGACHLRVLNNKPVNLISELNELENIGVSNFLMDFIIEENIEEIAVQFKKAFDDTTKEYKPLDIYTLGHYREGII